MATATIAGLGWAQAVPPPQQPGFPPPPPPQQAQQQDGDSPEHGVARLSLMQGEVSLRHGDGGEMSAAALNAPLVTTDRVATGIGARAEVQFDSSNMIRLAPSSEVRLGDLQYKRYLIQIAQGTTTFRVLRNPTNNNDAQIEISTPSISVRPLGQGTYRVMVSPDGTSEITVRNGEAEIFSPRGSEQLHAGQTMMARGDPNDPEFQVNAAIPADEWDRFNAQRDSELQRLTTSSRYVAPDVAGAEELDQNGRWVNDPNNPSYGNVWVPNVGPGWAPYRNGRWVWEDFYGWTWVSDDPWGWAPYHYGNWYMGPLGWAWWPGIYGGPHYWRPAMVGFFGWGGGLGIGVGFGFGFGHVGWVPLAPFEAFRPWYGGRFGGGIVNNVNIANNYRNARFVNGVNGVTSMRAGEFGRGAVNTGNFVRASGADLARAGSIQGRMPVTPGAQSMRMADRSVNTAGMPQAANTRFAGRSSFGPAAATGGVNAGRTNTAGGDAGGWQRMSPSNGGTGGGAATRGFGTGNAGGAVANRGGAQSGSGGWRGFTPGSTAGSNNGSAGSVAPRGGYAGANGGGYAGAATTRAPAPRTGGYAASPGSYSAPQSRGFSPQQQPVRISPPIVSNRGASGGAAARPDVHSGFGGAHSSGGGGNRGGGGGGGHRGR